MSKSPSIMCLFVALALVASGCGESTKTASTSASTSTPAGTSTPAQTSTPTNESSHTVGPSTSPKETPPANKASQPSATEKAAQRKPQPEASDKKAEATKPSGETGTPHLTVPPKRLFPKRLAHTFLVACAAAKGSPSSCECILARQELNKVEQGQSVAEDLVLEAVMEKPGASLEAMRHGVRLPALFKRNLELCKVTNR